MYYKIKEEAKQYFSTEISIIPYATLEEWEHFRVDINALEETLPPPEIKLLYMQDRMNFAQKRFDFIVQGYDTENIDTKEIENILKKYLKGRELKLHK